MLKRCGACGTEKPLGEFSKSSREIGGLQWACRPCGNEKNRAHYAKNRDARRATQKRWAQMNKERINAAVSRYRQRHPDRYAASQDTYRSRRVAVHRAWYALNLEEKRARNRRWSKINSGKHQAIGANRRAREAQRTPSWVDLDAIIAIYDRCISLSKDTGIKHNVDHVLPLFGKKVSGLHVEANLQIIPERENKSKGNRFDPAQVVTVSTFNITAGNA